MGEHLVTTENLIQYDGQLRLCLLKRAMFGLAVRLLRQRRGAIANKCLGTVQDTRLERSISLDEGL